MKNQEIKSKAWEEIKDCINLNDDDFNASAISFKISDNYNLVVWCDIDKEYNENEPRYFIVSIRYNPHDELFGAHISNLEWSTNDLSKEGLEKAIDILMDSLEDKKLIRSNHIRKYEEFKLQWMLDRGYTLEDIFKELDEIYEDWIDYDGKAPKPSILFDEFELDYGFNEELYPSLYEWFKNDY